jgi:Fe-S cluster assembly protein SufD
MPLAMPTASEQALKELNPYLAAFEEFEKRPEAGHLPWLRAFRTAGIAYFGELGFPTLKDEEWKYTSVAAVQKMPFIPAFRAGPTTVCAEDARQFEIDGFGHRLVFVNGRFNATLSNLAPLAKGVRVGSLAAAIGVEPGLQDHFGTLARIDDHAFRALNAAFFLDGAFVWIPKGVQSGDNVHIVNISTAHQEGLATHSRNLVVLEPGAHATLMESFVSLGASPGVTNSVSEIVVGPDASLEYIKLQDEHAQACHFGTVQARLARGSRYTATSVSNGASISRHDMDTVLDGEGGECVLNGLYLGANKQVVDHHMVVDHAKPNCASHEFFNGILDGQSRGVFNGKILVRKDAQKTDAKQSNRNILVTNEATVDTKPQLEIFADDVKCTHGATVGQLDEEGVFYLRSRGIDKEGARRMLIHAFGGEIINRVRHPQARARLDAFLAGRLAVI